MGTVDYGGVLLAQKNRSDVLSNMGEFLSSGSFADMTLAAGGKKIKAHKVLLAASSPYLKELLKVSLPSKTWSWW